MRWLDEIAVNGNRAAAAGFVSPTFTMYSDAGEQRLSLDEWPNWRAEASREENLDEFVRRVGGERQAMPGSVMEVLDCLVAGHRAMLRWSYSYPDSTATQPSRLSG